MFTITGLLGGIILRLSSKQSLSNRCKRQADMNLDKKDGQHGGVKYPEDTKVEMCQIIQSIHLSKYGHLSSGQLLKWVDITACLAAEKLAGRPCVTLSVDDLYFEDHVQLGDVISLHSRVNRAFNTSMEVGVQVKRESDDGNFKVICEAFLTFVAINSAGRKVRLPPFLFETSSEEACFTLAEERRKVRLAHSNTMKNLLDSYVNLTDLCLSDSEVKIVKGLSTRVESVELVLPQHANHHGNTFGGQIMEWMESISSISAVRFAKGPIKLRSVDMIHFRGPSQVGDRIVLRALVNHATLNSIEVGVRVEAYNCEEGTMGDIRHINSAFFIFESSTDLPILDSSDTEDGIRRHREAVARAKIRLDRRYILSSKRTEKLSVILNKNNLMYLRLNNLGSLSDLAAKTDWKYASSDENLNLSTREQNGVLFFKVSKKLCSSKVNDYQAFKILCNPMQRKNWDPLMINCERLSEKVEGDDSVYRTIMRSGLNDDCGKKNEFILLYSCRKPTREGDSYMVAMRSVVTDDDVRRSNTGFDRIEVACAGFIIRQEPGQNTEISYYNETNPKMVSYVTSDVAGFTKVYSIVYSKMENYLVDTI